MLIRAGLLLPGFCLLPLPPLLGQPATPPPQLGTIAFPTSGQQAAQAEFLVGVLYLHSFEYQSAERAFRKAEALDPDFAIAHWGEAMSYTHPVWNEQDLSSGRAALERLGASAELRRAKAPTPRERGYLEAVELLYGPGPKARRDTLYAAAMEQLVRENPDDLEAKAFYALALLGLNQGVRDTVTYLRAAQYADTVFRANPDHPGAAHYLIHSYDDPLHAPLGLAAARAYIHIAPDAPHAQHMTTHIFLAMGMWDEVVSQNHVAIHQSARVPGHYTSWLVYGLVQQGRYDAARAMLEELRSNMSPGGTREQYTALVGMRAHYLLHSEAWNDPVARWKLDPGRMTPLGHLLDAYADGAIAYRRRDAAALTAAATEVARLAEALRAARGLGAAAGQIMAHELGGMQLFLSGSRSAALRMLREATALEDAMPMDFGPPLIAEPSHEVLGGMLLEMEPSEALVEYQRALLLGPGRSSALFGVARAAVASGHKSEAQRALDLLLANWHSADPRTRDTAAPLRRVISRMP